MHLLVNELCKNHKYSDLYIWYYGISDWNGLMNEPKTIKLEIHLCISLFNMSCWWHCSVSHEQLHKYLKVPCPWTRCKTLSLRLKTQMGHRKNIWTVVKGQVLFFLKTRHVPKIHYYHTIRGAEIFKKISELTQNSGYQNFWQEASLILKIQTS